VQLQFVARVAASFTLGLV